MRLSRNGRYALTAMYEDYAVCRSLAILKFKVASSLTEDQTRLVDRFVLHWLERNQLQEVWRWQQLHGLLTEYGYEPGFRIPTEPGKGSCYQVPMIGSTRRGKPRRYYVMRQVRAKADAYKEAVREFAPLLALRAERDMAVAVNEIEARERQYEVEQQFSAGEAESAY